MVRVTNSCRDESNSRRAIFHMVIKMINKSRWKILGVLAIFLVMVGYIISREESFYFPLQDDRMTCPLGEVEKKAAQLIANYTRDHPLFLQLKDYFWVKTPSLYELPYGTKGSDDMRTTCIGRIVRSTSSQYIWLDIPKCNIWKKT
ncbi:UNVERIFIED_CONTAM: hypothetical protein K2H54_023864 [Gekko kuhli]